MLFRVLGPLEVESENRRLPLGGARQRAVLAALVLHANHVVGRDRLLEAVWGEEPPDTAASALQGYVSALRKTVGTGAILTRAPGYVLEVDPDSIDLYRFESLAAEGADALASGDSTNAAELLQRALARWRGEPLADLDSIESVRLERVRLDEVRLGALADRIDADLALGRHAELVGELRSLVGEHPLRERFRGQLMLALYRSGRQAEALDVYREGRAALAAELGLEPGEPLKQLERAILRHDDALAPPPPAARPRAPEQRRSRSRGKAARRPLLGALAVAGLAGVAAATIVLLRPATSAPAVLPNSIAVVDPSTDRLVGDIPMDGTPVAIAGGPSGLYVASGHEGIVWRIDPSTRRVVARIGVGGDVNDLAAGFGSVWLADGTDGTITRIDDRLDAIQRRIPLGLPENDAPVYWIATGAGGVWVTRGASVVQIDPATNRVVRRVVTPYPAGLAVGLGAAWIASGQRLLRVGPGHTVVALPRDGRFPAAVAAPTVGQGAIWSIAYNGLGELWRMSPSGDAAVVGGLGRYPLAVTVGDGAAWTIDTRGVVSRIDVGGLRPVDRIATAPTIRSALATAGRYLWVAIQRPS